MSQPNKKSAGFLPQTLDVDDSIIDNNLKIIENKDLEDKITGIFPGLVNNANASSAKHYKTDRKLLPTDEYPTVQVLYKIYNELQVKLWLWGRKGLADLLPFQNSPTQNSFSSAEP